MSQRSRDVGRKF